MIAMKKQYLTIVLYFNIVFLLRVTKPFKHSVEVRTAQAPLWMQVEEHTQIKQRFATILSSSALPFKPCVYFKRIKIHPICKNQKIFFSKVCNAITITLFFRHMGCMLIVRYIFWLNWVLLLFICLLCLSLNEMEPKCYLLYKYIL